MLSKSPAMVETARAIYRHALSVFPTKKTLWMSAAMLEKEHGTPSTLESVLQEAVKHCPTAEVLWLMAAKEKWLAGDVPGARAILVAAFDANPNSEQIWLAAVKLEWENEEINRARLLLTKARGSAPTERMYMKAALLEREVGDIPAELALLEEGISRYPSFAKYYMMAGQACHEVLKDLNLARQYYQRGTQHCPDNVTLWILLAKLEVEAKGVIKARSTMETARLKFPKNPDLWLQSIRFEHSIPGNEKLAEALMARALQECPDSGVLWSEQLMLCTKQQQKSKSMDALKRCDNDPLVVLAIARLFEKDRKYAKAQQWFERAVTLAPKLGDAWVYLYAFELRQARLAKLGLGQQPNCDVVVEKCVAAQPNRGELWLSVAKRTEYRRKDVATTLKKAVELALGTAGAGLDSHKENGMSNNDDDAAEA